MTVKSKLRRTLRDPRKQGRIGFLFKPCGSIQQLPVGETEIITVAGIIAAELSDLLRHRGAAQCGDQSCQSHNSPHRFFSETIILVPYCFKIAIALKPLL